MKKSALALFFEKIKLLSQPSNILPERPSTIASLKKPKDAMSDTRDRSNEARDGLNLFEQRLKGSLKHPKLFA